MLLFFFLDLREILISGILILPLGLFTIIGSLLVQSVGYGSKITFNRNYFKLEHQIFGWSYSQQTGEISGILGTFIYAGGAIHEIRIRSDNNMKSSFYVLAKNLNEVEATWLAQEIQDWLNLR
jgi:hypothetical protein